MLMDQLNITNSNITNSNITNSNITSWNPGNIVSGTLMGLCCIVGLPANIVVLVVILRQVKQENFTLKLMLNLTCSDIMCLVTLPVWISELLSGWSLGRGFCKFILFMTFCSLHVSIMSVTMMSVQRYLSVLYPCQWARLGRKGETVLLLLIWGLACILTVPALKTYTTVKHGSHLICERYTNSDWEVIAISCFENCYFLVLFSILVTFYSCLHKRVNQSALFTSQRMTRVIIRITVIFIILWFPYFIVNTVDILAVLLKFSDTFKSAKLETFSKLTRDIAKSLVLLSSCVDPFLYGFSFQKIWKRLRQRAN